MVDEDTEQESAQETETQWGEAHLTQWLNFYLAHHIMSKAKSVSRRLTGSSDFKGLDVG